MKFENWSKQFIQWATICWLVLVVILHFLPGSKIPDVSWFEYYHGDKFVHALMFLPLGIGLHLGFHFRKITAVIFVLVVAASLELIQGTNFVGRSTDVLDFCADFVGVILGIVIIKAK